MVGVGLGSHHIIIVMIITIIIVIIFQAENFVNLAVWADLNLLSKVRVIFSKDPDYLSCVLDPWMATTVNQPWTDFLAIQIIISRYIYLCTLVDEIQVWKQILLLELALS